MRRLGFGAAVAAASVATKASVQAQEVDPPEPGWIELERPHTPDTTRAFYPAALSGDGHIVVGREWYTDTEDGIGVSRAAMWNRGSLSWLAEPSRSGYVPPHALAYAINRDGSVIGGLASLPDPNDGPLNGACMWYEGSPLHVQSYPGMQPVFITGVNSLGSTMVGRALIGKDETAAFSIRLGVFRLLEPLTGAAGEATAVSVSHDGRVVVGFSTNESGMAEAVRWVDGEVESLGVLPWWATASYAIDTNQDGTVIVGRIMASTAAMHFRWENGAYEILEGLDPIGPVDVPYARTIRTNADGSVAVGGFNDRAFYWTRAGGTRPLRTVAIESGIAIPCCTRLLNALDVSDDGRTILVRGRGRDLVITLGHEDIPGDANGDGAVDLQDLNLLLSDFGLESIGGDLNGDGVVDLQDLNLLLQHFGS